MPSWLKFAGLWSLAAIAALTLSWVAVSQVRDRVIQPVTVIPTTIVALESETPDPTVVVVEPEQTDDRDPDFSESPDPESTDPTSSTTSTTVTTRPPSSGSGSSSTTSTTAPPSSTSSTTASTTSTTQPPQATTTTRAASGNLTTSSHQTPGGSVTIDASPGEVYFVSAIPQSGFTTELRDVGPQRVRVRFIGPSKIFEFEAEWDEGELEIDTSEHTP